MMKKLLSKSHFYHASLLLFICFFILTAAVKNHSPDRENNGGSGQKLLLFVFGDSYADTGNKMKANASSWKPPYGSTFPGKPSGRFSDGRVLTDFLAKHVGVKSPIPYRWMKKKGSRARLEDGVNFAYGGTGVFDTLVAEPNMTSQIRSFRRLVHDSVFNQSQVQSSGVFFVTLAGNDYSAFLAKGGTPQGLPAFISSVVNQLAVNLKFLYDHGARKVGVTSLEPLGCLPRVTVHSSFRECNTSQNVAVNVHNQLLQEAVERLNNQTNSSTFVLLDLYSTFTRVIEQKNVAPGSMVFQTPLKPCCMGTSDEHYCGSVDENGAKLYTVCSDPNAAFFWDGAHPTQAGWASVYSSLKPTLQQMLA
ncbi:unnamed protein product [Cuscuta campestris]|uniref:SGNH hydrolase-type esterase domain-containing protein n=1 Tax=Cuscuta campestris TaxID=132261 RepID=A0A484LCW2_9ASTE|nr:unnamed protein product [Cuscuta campestris]